MDSWSPARTRAISVESSVAGLAACVLSSPPQSRHIGYALRMYLDCAARGYLRFQAENKGDGTIAGSIYQFKCVKQPLLEERLLALLSAVLHFSQNFRESSSGQPCPECGENDFFFQRQVSAEDLVQRARQSAEFAMRLRQLGGIL